MVYYTRYPIKGGEPVPEMTLGDGTKMYYTRFGPETLNQPLPSFEFEGIYVDHTVAPLPNPDLSKKALYSKKEIKVKKVYHKGGNC
jgi:hypothetical protein